MDVKDKIDMNEINMYVKDLMSMEDQIGNLIEN